MPTFTDYYEHALQMAIKLMLGYGHTGIGRRPGEEREAYDPTMPLDTRVILHPEEMWGEPLPPTPPSLDSTVIAVHQNYPKVSGESGMWRLTPILSTGTGFPTEYMGWEATLNPTPPPDWGTEANPRLENWIPGKFGKLWEPELYEDFDGTGNNGPGAQIPASHALGWLFDPQSGIVTIETLPSVALVKVPLWLKGYRYIGDNLSDVIQGISAGASITLEDNVPTPFPSINIVRFGNGFVVSSLGANHAKVDLASSSSWPWPTYQLMTVPSSGTPGVPQDFALTGTATYMDHRAFVYIEGVKAAYGATKDYIFTNPTTIRFLNNTGRTILLAGMEIELYY